MTACYQKEFNRQRETIVRPHCRLTEVEEYGSFPLHAYQLTSRAAHALRVQLKATLPPALPGFAFNALNHPVSFVGGDYFGFQPTCENRLGVLLFDVAGKGPEAALIAARLRVLFHQRSLETSDVTTVLCHVNTSLRALISTCRFTTAIYGVLDPVQHCFTFCRAGHEPLVLVHNGQPQALTPQGLPLGVCETDEFAALLEVQSIELETEDRLFMFSDGLTEARNRRNDEFGLNRVLSELRTSNGDDVDTLSCAVGDFVQNEPQHDDLTMLSIRVLH